MSIKPDMPNSSSDGNISKEMQNEVLKRRDLDKYPRNFFIVKVGENPDSKSLSFDIKLDKEYINEAIIQLEKTTKDYQDLLNNF